MTDLNADRVVLSTISLRHLPLNDALRIASDLGFTRIDLGALPGVCDHVPFELDRAAVDEVVGVVRSSGLAVCSVNADIGDLNRPLDAAGIAERDAHRDRLIELSVGIDAEALVLPNGSLGGVMFGPVEENLDLVASELTRAHQAVEAAGLALWVEAPHSMRLANDIEQSASLFARLPAGIGAVLDVSHVVASGGTPREFLAAAGERLAHVHLRDAERGYIHHSIGRGTVDFADLIDALSEVGYVGALALELETRDIGDDDRAAEALRAGRFISDLLATSAARALASTGKQNTP